VTEDRVSETDDRFSGRQEASKTKGKKNKKKSKK
jgi:hypothetical protein